MAFTFTARNGTQVDVPESYLNPFTEELVGYCLNCGEEHRVEPDARGYICRDGCNKKTVYGAEELMIMGIFTDGGGDYS